MLVTGAPISLGNALINLSRSKKLTANALDIFADNQNGFGSVQHTHLASAIDLLDAGCAAKGIHCVWILQHVLWARSLYDHKF